MHTTMKYLIIMCCTISLARALIDQEITVNIEPRKEDCYFQAVNAGEKIEIEYQVIDGGHGDLDITFHLVDPTGRIIASDYKKSDNAHHIVAHIKGDWKFCFDNTFSSYNTKTIFFEMLIEKDGDTDEDWDEHTGNINEEVYELTVAEIQEAVNRVRQNLNSIRHLQDVIKSTEARDRNLAEENYFKVNTFSWVQIIVMMAVGLTQVIMVRSLFDDKSKVHGIWKKLSSVGR